MVQRNVSVSPETLIRFKRLSSLAAPYAASVAAVLLIWQSLHTTAVDRDATPVALAQTPAAQSVPAVKPVPQEASLGATIEVIVGRHDTMDAIFRRLALDVADLAAIRNLPGIRQSLDFLRPGDAIRVTHADGAVRELTRKVSETQTLEVTRRDNGFQAKLIQRAVETHVRTASTTINSSLFAAAAAAGISDPVALKLANVFAWDIDFVLDIREGDRFTAVYEQVWQDGKYLRDGEVLAAEFVNAGHTYRAVRFVNGDGSVGYYTPDGRAMRKAFLRAPVDFTRISSAFNPNRLHPILNLIRGHMGTDYAAPSGTPVFAAGDGKVGFMGTKGGYGNAIVLQHGNDIATLYGHMSRFARTLHAGSHVSQGETIGYVGMTGLATGPHLHYEYLVNGVHKDPQTVKLPGAESLKADAMARFQSAAAPLLGSLNPPAAAPASGAVAAPLGLRDAVSTPGTPGDATGANAADQRAVN
jgi:murein DD-endopeptidase MepM/ murein hydrolase activator NlpD